jgi:hypothetical protein
MVAARTAARGLSPADLDGIRETLAAGRRPRVMFTETAGQIAGQVGQVVQLGDPAGSEEFVVVRFGRDELPFSPADLAMPARGAARRTESGGNGRKGTKPAESAPGPELRLTEPPAVAARPVPAPREQEPPTIRDQQSGPGKAEPPAAPAPRKAGRAARPKPPAALTVTLAYTEGEWTVSATQGAKSLAKPYVIKPAEALKMVGLLDVPGVQEAVEHIVTAERAAAQEQALRLRNQLAEVEARLAELGELG